MYNLNYELWSSKRGTWSMLLVFVNTYLAFLYHYKFHISYTKASAFLFIDYIDHSRCLNGYTCGKKTLIGSFYRPLTIVGSGEYIALIS